MSKPTIFIPWSGCGFDTDMVKKTDVASVAANTSQKILDPEPRRKAFAIWNNSSNSCYFSFVNPAVAASPVRIQATFTSWEVYGPAIYTGVICAIRNSGTGTWTAWEWI